MELHRHSSACGAGALRINRTCARVRDRSVNHRKIPGSFVGGWDRRREGLTGSQPEPFPACEPEGPVAAIVMGNAERTACVQSKLILHPWWTWFSCSVQKKVIRVEDAIAEIFIRLTMKIVGRAFGTKIRHATSKSAPFRTKITGLHFEFLNGILSRNQHGQVDVSNVERLAIEVLGALVSERAAHLIIAPAERIHSDWCSSRTTLGNYRRRQDDEIENIAAIQR